MGVRMRFRTDSAFAAEDAARLERGDDMLWHRSRRELRKTPPAKPGDTWRIRWYPTDDEKRRGSAGAIAGYAICCPKCLAVHRWTQAARCGSPGSSAHQCGHADALASCWSWSGSAESGTLSATPSLYAAVDCGGCGWHGFLTNGELVGA